MGTNYKRIPLHNEMLIKKNKLLRDIRILDLEASSVKLEFRTIEKDGFEFWSPWDEFINETSVHLGKRSSGWKFLWNWNDGKYYRTKKDLLGFIRSGRVVNEYGELIDAEEFIKMALEWGQPDGYDLLKYYDENPSHATFSISSKKYEDYIDCLRVCSSTEFS